MDAEIRLQKYLSECGICSRREAESWIKDGLLKVNGRVAELGQKVDPENDFIKLRNKPLKLRQQKKLILAMNKPKGTLCSNDDPHHEKTVFSLLPPKYGKQKLFCAGRLDKDSEGLLIITNDGEFSNKLTHPSNGVIKRYHVTLNKTFNTDDIGKMLEGIDCEGELLKANKVIPAKSGPAHDHKLEIHLGQGRKREIRRIMEALRYRVKKLKRIQIGKFRLKNIAKGSCRELKDSEIKMLLHKA